MATDFWIKLNNTMDYNQITKLSKQVYQANVEKGFWEDGRSFAECIALIHSEVSEALEADRSGKTFSVPFKEFDVDWFKANVKDTREDELADAVIRILDLAGHLNIDLGKHIEMKLAYNSTRPRKHGKAY